MDGREAPPLLSVYSALHNRLEGIEESIASVLDQRDVDLEYVVVDDCSTDGTLDYLLSIDDPRLVVLRNVRNIGFTRSILRALSQARGRYAAAQDGGDVSLPGRFRAQVDFLEAHPDVAVVGVGVVNHHVALNRRAPFPGRVREGDREIVRYTHGEVMFRKAIYDAVGGYRDVFYYSQDKDLWNRMQAHGRLEMIDEIFYERRIFPDSVQGDIIKLGRQAIFSNLVVHVE